MGESVPSVKQQVSCTKGLAATYNHDFVYFSGS